MLEKASRCVLTSLRGSMYSLGNACSAGDGLAGENKVRLASSLVAACCLRNGASWRAGGRVRQRPF